MKNKAVVSAIVTVTKVILLNVEFDDNEKSSLNDSIKKECIEKFKKDWSGDMVKKVEIMNIAVGVPA